MWLHIDPDNPQPELLKQAAEVLRQGGVAAIPTDTSYGLAVNPYDDQAVKKVYQLKGRDFNKPLILLISNPRQLDDLVQDISPQAEKLMADFWPGPLTLIFQVNKQLQSLLIGATGKIGVRLPDNRIACALIDLAKTPLTATSANPSGCPSPFSACEVADYFPDNLDVIIDSGKSVHGLDSTILDVSETPFRLIRSGAIPPELLHTLGSFL